jgi:hypothetical protein
MVIHHMMKRVVLLKTTLNTQVHCVKLKSWLDMKQTSGCSTVYMADNRSEKSSESSSILYIRHHGQNLLTCEASAISNDLNKTDVCIEDALQGQQEEQDYAKLHDESGAKRGDGGDVAVVLDGKKTMR